MKNLIEKTALIQKNGFSVLEESRYIAGEITDQQNSSMLGQRTRFLAFQRFMYELADADIQRLMTGLKKLVKEHSGDAAVYCDLRILKDVIDFHVVLRSNKDFDAAILSQIAKSYNQNQHLSNDFADVTSDHLITLCKKMLCDHSIVKCMCCGAEDSPAKLMASRPRTVTPAMTEQRKNAGAISGAKRRKTPPANS